jgi:hypothetical protein
MTHTKDEALKLALDRAVPSILSPGWVMIPDKDFDAIKQALAAQPAPVHKDANSTQETAETRMDTGFAGGAQPAVPEGWKLVPIKPTMQMINALADTDPEHESVWDAVLAAAPEKGN